METYNLTEQEQIQMVKSWLKKYAPSIIIGIILSFVLSFGWHHWTQRQILRVQQASILYEQMLASQTLHSGESNQIADEIIATYAHTPYATFAALFQASQAVTQNNLTLATQKLNWVIAHGKNATYKQIAKLRLARILLAQNQLSQAMDTVTNISDNNFLPAIELVKGDIFVAMKNTADAKTAYQQALQTLPKVSSMRSLIEMKLANLAS